jgi:hypothetical protein
MGALGGFKTEWKVEEERGVVEEWEADFNPTIVIDTRACLLLCLF